MSGKKSRNKGKVGEREFAQFLKDRGLTARRSSQYCGQSGEAADVLCDEMPYLHFEVKRTEAFSLYPALHQAMSESKFGQLAVVLHRRSRKDWVVIMDADQFFVLWEYAGLLEGRSENLKPPET